MKIRSFGGWKMVAMVAVVAGGCGGAAEVAAPGAAGACQASVTARIDAPAEVMLPAALGSGWNPLGAMTLESQGGTTFDGFNFGVYVTTPANQRVDGCLERVVAYVDGRPALASCAFAADRAQYRCHARFDTRFDAARQVATFYVDIGAAGTCPVGTRLALTLTDDDTAEIAGVQHLAQACNHHAAPMGAALEVVPFLVTVEPGDPLPGANLLARFGAAADLGSVNVINSSAAPVTVTQSSFALDGRLRDPNQHLTGTFELRVSPDAMTGGDYSLAATAIDAVGEPVEFQRQLDRPFTLARGSSRSVRLHATLTDGAVQPGDSVHLSLDARTTWAFKVSEADLGYDADLDGHIGGDVVFSAADGLPIRLGQIQAQ